MCELDSGSVPQVPTEPQRANIQRSQLVAQLRMYLVARLAVTAPPTRRLEGFLQVVFLVKTIPTDIFPVVFGEETWPCIHQEMPASFRSWVIVQVVPGSQALESMANMFINTVWSTGPISMYAGPVGKHHAVHGINLEHRNIDHMTHMMVQWKVLRVFKVQCYLNMFGKLTSLDFAGLSLWRERAGEYNCSKICSTTSAVVKCVDEPLLTTRARPTCRSLKATMLSCDILDSGMQNARGPRVPSLQIEVITSEPGKRDMLVSITLM